VLSPANKSGVGLAQYRLKRAETIVSEISLVEFDFLHQTPAVITGVNPYPDAEESYPYTIAINDRRPTEQFGRVNVYGWHVDEPMPIVYIPLKGQDFLAFDPNPSYDDLYESLPALSYRLDYALPPKRVETYSPADQERIQTRMAIISEALRRGIDLETGPFGAELLTQTLE
jgi:hypothetical protein